MIDGPQGIEVLRPHPGLAPFIDRYQSYEFAGGTPGTYQGLPSSHLTLILSLADPIVTTATRGSETSGTFQSFVAGLHTKPVTISHDGSGKGVHIVLSPFGSRALLGLPASALAGCTVPLGDLIGTSRANELLERITAVSHWSQRFEVLDHLLSSLVREDRGQSVEVVRAWELLNRSTGMLRTSELAAEVGYSRRHLSQRFGAELGLTPKSASRVIRFEHACGLLNAGVGLAETAFRAGFADQAHLSNEWRDLAGLTPKEWLQETLRDPLPDVAPLRSRAA